MSIRLAPAKTQQWSYAYNPAVDQYYTVFEISHEFLINGKHKVWVGVGRPHRCFAIGLFLDLRCQSRFFDVWWPRIFNDKGLRWSGPLRPIEMFISY